MVPASPPLVVPKTRTRVVGGEQVTTISREIELQGTADLQWMLRRIATDETAAQISIQNPPQQVVVDGNPARGFDEAKRRVVVLFGTKLASAAMRQVEMTLRQNITKATQSRSGKLADVSGSWRWKLVTPGKGTTIVSSATQLPMFTRGSMLILEPFGVPYATRVNSLVLGSGRLRARKSVRVKRGLEGPPKPKQPVGFLRATVEALRARAEFRDFAITVVFSKRHMVPSEVSRLQGTGSIVIQLKRRTAR